MKHLFAVAAILFTSLVIACEPPPEDVPPGPYDAILSKINLPDGFKINVFAEIANARSLAFDPDTGTLFIGQRGDSVYSARDTDGDGVADQTIQLASGLNVPNGLAVSNGSLFVALNDSIIRWPIPNSPVTPADEMEHKAIFTGLPAFSQHGWRYAKIGPDGMIYVSIGSPCNICEPPGITGSILRLNLDGSNPVFVAVGIRNSVGFDWHPQTGDLYFTDNGADGMGDDLPADELNRVSEIGQHFGFPFFGGTATALPGFEDTTIPDDLTAPVIEFQAHTTPLGMHFYRGDMFPSNYKNDAFVAQHGSWDRAEPVGYRVMRITFDNDGNATGSQVFADGWLTPDGAVGRPVDVTELPDGSLLISDDFAGLIYRIWYDG